jgi:thioredoxin 1
MSIKVLDFYADWCVPCKRISPVIDNLNTKMEDVEFEKVNVEEQYELAEKYNITSVPTFVFEREGNEVHRITGAMNPVAFEAQVNNFR